MFTRLTPAPLVLAASATLFLAGCFPRPLVLPNDSQQASRPPAPSRVRQDASAAPELRIPGEPVAQQKTEIPVVPVPPIPNGQGVTQRTTMPPPTPDIQPVSTLPPLQPGTNPPPPPVQPMPMPVTNATPANPMEKGDLKQVIQQANDAYGQYDSYIARLTRREQVSGKNKPEEVMLFKFRKRPWSVYFKWLGTEGHDREVTYVKGQYENKIHTLLAAGDSPLMPAGKRMALAPDSIFVRNASRHSIAEAGLGASVERLTAVYAATERGDRTHGTLTDRGIQKRPDYDGTLRLVEHTIPPNVEDSMPRGGKRLYGFDTTSCLPVLLVCSDDKGQEVEYYRYDKLFKVKLDDADFNPDNLGASTKTSKQP